jgi:hypothetical protein
MIRLIAVIGFVVELFAGGLVLALVLAQEPSPVATPTPTATATPTATPTVGPEVQFREDKITSCKDSVRYYYLSRTGIELTLSGVTYVVTDSGAEVTGLANSTDDRFTGPLDFKCVFGELMEVPMMLTEIHVTPEPGR